MEAWSEQPHSTLDCTGSGQGGGFLPPWSPAHGRPDSVPLVSLLTEVDNPRRPQARRHALEAILLIATLAVICGADNGIEVELFGLQKQAWLETFLDLPHGILSHDTFGSVFSLLDPARLEACFAAWVQSPAATLQDEIVAADGKAPRGSHDQARRVSPLHLLKVLSNWNAIALRHNCTCDYNRDSLDPTEPQPHREPGLRHRTRWVPTGFQFRLTHHQQDPHGNYRRRTSG
ncbi:MAG: ISAs1 family transposase, partial [Caldilineaceae bacterium SB0670_bin_27]|nr:ISAs1 family transposase [Caldilineaceae bacterium SB0670_bin_27]